MMHEHSGHLISWLEQTGISHPVAVPLTYALIANPFKNWRGMTESGGRRIKRALYLDAMTFLIRQLEPGSPGLPLEIYVFSNDQVWANYEALQADIFDHLIAVLPYFHRRIFQQPSGYDFKIFSDSYGNYSA